MALSSQARRAIINAVWKGNVSFADLGRRHGVSREYIRQLAAADGITGSEMRKTKRDEVIAVEAAFLVDDREMYIPPRWAQRPFSRSQFEAYLKENDPDLLVRWGKAQALPLSNSGHAHPNGQRCTDCKMWKPWDEFYSDTSRIYGYSSRCQKCAKDQAKAAYHAGRETT